MLLHSDRYAPGAPTHRNGVVVHDSEGSEGVLPWGQTSSEQLLGLLAAKGDRPSPSRPGGVYGAGYQAVAREDGTFVTVADDNVGPYHAGGGINANMWSICIPGRASQSREQWLDAASRPYIRAVAAYIVERWHHDGRAWPLMFASGAELRAAHADQPGHPVGYTSHAQVTASKLTSTDHTDPGVAFPWDVLAEDITALVAPQEDDMKAPLFKEPNDAAVFSAAGMGLIWVDNIGDLHVAQAAGLVVSEAEIQVKPREWFVSFRLLGAVPPGWSNQAGVDFRQVVGG